MSGRKTKTVRRQPAKQVTTKIEPSMATALTTTKKVVEQIPAVKVATMATNIAKQVVSTVKKDLPWTDKVKRIAGKSWAEIRKFGVQDLVSLGAAFVSSSTHLQSLATGGVIPAGTLLYALPISPSIFKTEDGDSNITKYAEMHTFYEFLNSKIVCKGLTSSEQANGAIGMFINPNPSDELATTEPALIRQALHDYGGVVCRPDQTTVLSIPHSDELLYTDMSEATDEKFLEQGTLYIISYSDINLSVCTFDIELKYDIRFAKDADNAMKPFLQSNPQPLQIFYADGQTGQRFCPTVGGVVYKPTTYGAPGTPYRLLPFESYWASTNTKLRDNLYKTTDSGSSTPPALIPFGYMNGIMGGASGQPVEYGSPYKVWITAEGQKCVVLPPGKHVVDLHLRASINFTDSASSMYGANYPYIAYGLDLYEGESIPSVGFRPPVKEYVTAFSTQSSMGILAGSYAFSGTIRQEFTNSVPMVMGVWWSPVIDKVSGYSHNTYVSMNAVITPITVFRAINPPALLLERRLGKPLAHIPLGPIPPWEQPQGDEKKRENTSGDGSRIESIRRDAIRESRGYASP